MIAYIFPAFIVGIFLVAGYQTFIAPRRWMKKHGDGVYSPLRRAYKNAGAANSPKS